MFRSPAKQLLVVDDDPGVRETVAILLQVKGYGVSTAQDGLDALAQLQVMAPALIIADLNMPNMSGFEFLSVVRRRFPQVPVIAMSGAYGMHDSVPAGVVADAFYTKGCGNPGRLVELVEEVLGKVTKFTSPHTGQTSPVWVPRQRDAGKRAPFIVLTCTQCLRSFPCTRYLCSKPPEDWESIPPVMSTECVFCLSEVRYIIDWTEQVITRKKECSAACAPAAQEAKCITQP